MLKSLICALLVASAFLVAAEKDPKDQNWKPTPLMRSVAPDTAKVGDIVTVAGDYLEKTHVKEIYLTTGNDEIKTEIVEQSANEAKVKIPAKAKPARYHLMVLTTGVDPQLLEQPVVVEVQE